MTDRIWMRWVMQTARTWKDMTGIINEIGIEDVDEQHYMFTMYVLELNHLIRAFSDRNVSFAYLNKGEAVFQTLLEYAKTHFAFEEGLMEEMSSPLIEAHKEQHIIFLDLLTNHYEEYKQGRLQMVSGLKVSILDWWVNHINGIDSATFKSQPTEGHKE